LDCSTYFTFAVLVSALALRQRRGDWHKRLMLLASRPIEDGFAKFEVASLNDEAPTPRRTNRETKS
jgi:hypothetical protein